MTHQTVKGFRVTRKCFLPSFSSCSGLVDCGLRAWPLKRALLMRRNATATYK
uniref:Uncharacterized protein n=1 Tax=Anguilla anguilla TaxID=7936 RepID=A0A0E9USW4_ANGAN